MPQVIKDGVAIEDSWIALDAASEAPDSRQVHSLAQWQAATALGAVPAAVQLEPGDEVAELKAHLNALQLVAVHFPLFTDGRGFSYARYLREQGYRGELRAVGDFLADQLFYLKRCGFDAFAPLDSSAVAAMVEGSPVISESYQASIDQPQPLFRRR